MKKFQRRIKDGQVFSSIHSVRILRSVPLLHTDRPLRISDLLRNTFCVLVIFFASTLSSYGEGTKGTIHIYAGTYLPAPFIKSKLGFARAVSHEKLPESIRFTSLAMPRAFCSEIDFDDVEDRNFALEPSPFENNNFSSVQPNPWFKQLVDELTSRNIKQYYQLIGAPKPFQQKVIERPAIHPTPTDILQSAKLTAAWVSPYLKANPSINWVIWNEPSHTLRGKPTPMAAEDMANIYRSYYKEINPISPYDSFGLAGFIAASVNVRKTGSFMNSVLHKIVTNKYNGDLPPIEFISLNNYHGKIDKLLNSTNYELALLNENIPIIMTQYAPEAITQGRIEPGSIRAAIQYIEDLDTFVQNNTVQHVCMSYFVGGEKAFILSKKGQALTPQPTLLALGLYQKLPVWRISAQADKDIRSKILAGRDNDAIRVLLYNPTGREESVLLKVHEIAKDTQLNQRVNVECISSTGVCGKVEDINLVHMDEVSIEVESDKIYLVTVKTTPSTPTEATNKIGRFISSKMFVNRNQQNLEPRNQFGYYDQINQSFTLGVDSYSDIAIAEATYLTTINNLEFIWKTPPGVDTKDIQNCSFIIIQSNDGNRKNTRGYGKKEVLSRVEAMVRQKIDNIEPLSFDRSSNDSLSAHAVIPHFEVRQNEMKGSALSLYIGLAGCAKSVQENVSVSAVDDM